MIELHRGSLLVRWNFGSGEMYVHVREKTFSDDQWHSVDIKSNQRQLDMTLSGNLHVSRTFPGRFISFDLKQGEGDVRIGGYRQMCSLGNDVCRGKTLWVSSGNQFQWRGYCPRGFPRREGFYNSRSPEIEL